MNLFQVLMVKFLMKNKFVKIFISSFFFFLMFFGAIADFNQLSGNYFEAKI